MKKRNFLRSLPFFWRAAAGLLLPYALGLGLFSILLRPSLDDFNRGSWLMGISTLAAFILVYGAYRLGWIYRSPHFRWTLLAAYVIPAGLVFINIMVTARVMFANLHDLLLVTVLLVFASGITIVAGFLFTHELTERIQAVSQSAGRFIAGESDIRVPVHGCDEVAGLMIVFNQTATRMQETERQAQRVNSLRSDLIAWAGSDLRTPLTVARAILEDLASGEVNDPAAIQSSVQTAQEELGVLVQIIADLYEISRLDSGGLRPEMQPNSFGNLFSTLIKSFAEPARLVQVEIIGQVEPGVDPAWIDAPLFGRALRNLVGNALRRTPEGGQITLHAWRAEGAVWIEIRDTSPGFTPQDLPHLFDRFSNADQTKSDPAGDGSEMGLTLARSIIQAHQGILRAENEPGHGARFIIQLALTPPGIGASRSIPSTLEEF